MGPTRLTLSKPVIAAIENPAVADGMELALWADCRVMATGSYMGVYNRRWGLPLSNGGTVRLPRLVGQGRAAEIILTGRQIDAEECLWIGLCERVVPKRIAREVAEQMAFQIAQFPQARLRADLRACRLQHGLSERTALEMEWSNCKAIFNQEGGTGATKFALGAGRHGDPIDTPSDRARSSSDQRSSLPLRPWPAQRALARMALFILQTGCRDNVVRNLRWSQDIRRPELPFSVFEIPREFIKSCKRTPYLLCNLVAQRLVNARRGVHLEFVFVY